ncbi:hypothetical protein PsAD37_03441 [Pseudovibrio sp. Ad37]|nr:hypothetical protein PsAD37_03441 [Pseudovibrio sp. Ad37]
MTASDNGTNQLKNVSQNKSQPDMTFALSLNVFDDNTLALSDCFHFQIS